MTPDDNEKILIRYLNKSATASDLDKLNDWIKNPEDYLVFKDYIKTYFAITIGMNNPDSNDIRERLLLEIRKEKYNRKRRRLRSVFKYAAIAILFLGIGFLLKDMVYNKGDKPLVPKKETITLELDNGNKKIIKGDGSANVVDRQGNIIGVQQGKTLTYSKKAAVKANSYNTLRIPYGKRFNLVLSDGTKVFLNSGSSIKYPVNFSKDTKREVYLTGEAYFDVAHDKTWPFVVNAQELQVQVLGTKFNLSNYQENNNTEVVLVEGSVSLSSQETPETPKMEILLKPGFKGTFDRTDKNITAQKVNTAIYTSWIDGNLVFRKVFFEDIIRSLERQYNVTIINNNEKLAGQKFNATIEVDNETIEQVFNYFNKVYHIDYTIVENKIIIN